MNGVESSGTTPTLVHGRIVFDKIGSECWKGWGLLLYSTEWDNIQSKTATVITINIILICIKSSFTKGS